MGGGGGDGVVVGGGSGTGVVTGTVGVGVGVTLGAGFVGATALGGGAAFRTTGADDAADGTATGATVEAACD